jgi:hypothetical protein
MRDGEMRDEETRDEITPKWMSRPYLIPIGNEFQFEEMSGCGKTHASSRITLTILQA